LTELCGNTTMTLLAGTLEAVWSFQESRVAQVSLTAEDRPDQADMRRMRRRAVSSHRRLIAAIDAGNGDRASREMRRHITDMQQGVIGAHGSAVIDLATTPTAGSPYRSAQPSASAGGS
jgi:GntR family transcriptional regulator, transcriptional repressor for pyruvate dehydrogenase complex